MPIDHSPQEISPVYRAIEHMSVDLAWLAMQERLWVERMGGLFPERENKVEDFTRALHITSGSGYWAVSMARKNSELEVIGLERKVELVRYASSLAEAQRVDNARFDLLEPEVTHLTFPDAFFDVVHVAFPFTLLRVEEWPSFFKESTRVLRPGGYLRITEAETEMTNSPALERLNTLFLQGLQRAGQLSPDAGGPVEALTHVAALWRTQGMAEIVQHTYACDYGRGPYMPLNPERRIELLALLLKPLLVDQKIIRRVEFEDLLAAATRESGHEDFQWQFSLLTLCGRVPE
jgi:ubiquinone/menaquinone biosynthesis C-methylase UbiE